ncbi:MAG: DEAD/DEAH box helicase, partial [Gammaproteobacteria bacterium]|nr:DEAD/DEAH box helicase [Gammaproteobacteria bacterium]
MSFWQRPSCPLSPDLPISDCASEIIAGWQKHSIIIIQAETGSGKSTQIPKIALNMLTDIERPRIAMTQPRRLATQVLATRLQHEFQGNGLAATHVGWQIRHHNHTSTDSFITVMTEGILLQQILNDRLLKKYDVIILDEVHERSVHMDLLCGLLKKIHQKRPELKIALLSATLDLDLFQKFFPKSQIISCPGRHYPVVSQYLDTTAPISKIDEPLSKLLWALNQADTHWGDILVFCATEYEILTLKEQVEKRFPHYEVLPLYSRLPPSAQNKVFDIRQIGHKRRVILSTNVAQTSVTVPNLGVVIDFGTQKIMHYHPRMQFSHPQIMPIAQDAIAQRKGRAGRVQNGICFHLYSQEDAENRPLHSEPEILRTNCMAIGLKIFAFHSKPLETFPFLTSPERSQLIQATDNLLAFNLITQDYHLTPLGQEVVKSSYDPRLALILKEAARLGVLSFVSVIVSFLSSGDMRLTPFDAREKATNCHKQDYDSQSDFIAIVRLWLRIQESKKTLSRSGYQTFLHQNFLHPTLTHAWVKECSMLGESPVTLPSDMEITLIHRALLAGFWDMIFQKKPESPDGITRYRGARGVEMIYPTRVKGAKEPLWVIALEIQKQRNGTLLPRFIGPIAEHDILHYAQSRITVQEQGYEYCETRHMVFAKRIATLWGLKIQSLGRHWILKSPTPEARTTGISGLISQLTNSDLLNKIDSAYRTASWTRAYYAAQKLADYTRTEHLKQSVSECIRQAEAHWPTTVYDGPSFLEYCRHHSFRSDVFFITHHCPAALTDFPSQIEVQNYSILIDYHPHESHAIYSISTPNALFQRINIQAWTMLHPYYSKQMIAELIDAIPKKIRSQLESTQEIVDFFWSEYKWPEPWEISLKNFMRQYYDIELSYNHLPKSVQYFFPMIWVIMESGDLMSFSLKEHWSRPAQPMAIQKKSSQFTDRDTEMASAYAGHLLKWVSESGDIEFFQIHQYFEWRTAL